ncbi:hypothetical protein N7495_007944 [Penicillium taxi]|uniref:uncharacterized protein n=1 Tax=Penicillium taxi TaxID=168475 RepID=UPI002544E228|nr:uncharacterized protein N7495_007944 [Penicillium taxi]KAJ5887903.1 hypothetical protein N7495_007944 [Penicillium taxi]
MSESQTTSDHLCVLVHGLWGNPAHLEYVASTLRERYGETGLHILSAKGNDGNMTYDGIEVGGERLMHEIEDTLEALEAKGQTIKRLSIVGYSLGGLVSRYAIGLLQARGLLDKLEPVNFTTFATPHVGVRTPAHNNTTNHVWNWMGSRILSMSGQQMFLEDSFRDTRRPLLSIMADPDSIFIQGLRKFRNRSVYANLVNDRSVTFWTASFSKVDPFQHLNGVNIKYVPGYDQVIVDPDQYLLPFTPKERESLISRIRKGGKKFANEMPFYLLILLLAGPAATIFLAYSGVQSVRSRNRIRLHREGDNGILFGKYRVPLLVQNAQHVMEEVFENVNARQEPEYLSSTDAEASDSSLAKADTNTLSRKKSSERAPPPYSLGTEDTSKFPRLALTPEQSAIVDSLNDVGFHKYPVYIHNHRHSHAAIIVRMEQESFAEGKIVMKHWLDNEFVN